MLQNNAGFTEFVQAKPVSSSSQGHFSATAVPVHPSLVDSHIRDPKSQGSRSENQNQFTSGNAIAQGSRFESSVNQQQVSFVSFPSSSFNQAFLTNYFSKFHDMCQNMSYMEKSFHFGKL
jgi:hypothetical protein